MAAITQEMNTLVENKRTMEFKRELWARFKQNCIPMDAVASLDPMFFPAKERKVKYKEEVLQGFAAWAQEECDKLTVQYYFGHC